MELLNTYLDLITFETILYFGGTSLFFLIWALSRFHKVEEGILIQLVKKINLLFIWGLHQLQGMTKYLMGAVKNSSGQLYVNHMMSQKTGKWAISLWSLITVGALFTSYSATREWASWVGFESGISWAIPLIIDFVIVAAILTNAYYAFSGEDDNGSKAIVGTYTLVSVIINIAHLTFNREITFMLFLGGIVAPIGIFFCSEQIYRVVKSMTLREGLIKTDGELEIAIKERTLELEKVEGQLSLKADLLAEQLALQEKVLELRNDRDYLEGVIEKLDASFVDKVPNGQGRLEQVRVLAESGADASEVAKELNITDKTARSYYRSAVNGKA